jgi:hypothetical protein
MRIGTAMFAAAGALALFASGCGGKESCPSESPKVNALASNCEAVAGQTVSYPLQLCPTCNQTISGCDVQMSGTDIFLNPTAEACSSASSCPPSCSAMPNTCSFKAPSAAPGSTFTVSVFDPGTGGTKAGTLTIVASSPSCSL